MRGLGVGLRTWTWLSQPPSQSQPVAEWGGLRRVCLIAEGHQDHPLLFPAPSVFPVPGAMPGTLR